MPFVLFFSLKHQIRTVLLSIQALLSAPNPDDPLDNDVADVWKVKSDPLFLFCFEGLYPNKNSAYILRPTRQKQYKLQGRYYTS